MAGERPNGQSATDQERRTYLQKPYTAEEVLEAIATVLGKMRETK